MFLASTWQRVSRLNTACPRAVHRVGFDNWYPGFLDFTHIFRNSISFFTETALYAYATPHFYSVNDFPRDRQGLRSEIFYSSPWKGGWWRLSDAVQYMLGASMSVLDTAAKYREVLLYNRYQAARDNIAKFQKEPPYAYVIPGEQRDLPTAGILVDKLLTNGIEVHQATQPFSANGREYPDAWVVLMDQPFSPLVKELFETQQWPDLRTTPNGAPQRPYDVAGWTLPLQMGVEVAPVITPLSEQQRAGLRRIDTVMLPPGGVQGTGATYSLSRDSNAAYRVINRALAGGAQVSLTKSDAILTGDSRAPPCARRLTQHESSGEGCRRCNASEETPERASTRARQPVIDEGWTRWILEDFGFAPVTLRNGDVRAGHLRERLDVILLADSSTRSILDGYAAGVVPGEYSGGLGEPGAAALRDFVRDGGTLIAFNNASLFAIDQFHLPVANVLAGLTPEQFLLLRLSAANRIERHGPPGGRRSAARPGCDVRKRPRLRYAAGIQRRRVLFAIYPRDSNPLASGYLLHPERIQGKAAALEAFYGQGRIFLFGFRPQWRGQSHGTYKFFFNAIYDRSSPLKPASAEPAPDRWTAVVAPVKTDLGALLGLNQAFFDARGPAAVEARSRLNTALDQFEKERIQEVQDTAAGMDEANRKKASDLVKAMRKAASDLRTKEVESGVDAAALASRYNIE